MPVLFDRKRGNRERARKHAQVAGCRESLADVSGQRGYEIRFRDHRTEAKKAGQLQHHPPLYAELRQSGREQVSSGSANDAYVRGLLVVGDREPGARAAATLSDEATEILHV